MTIGTLTIFYTLATLFTLFVVTWAVPLEYDANGSQPVLVEIERPDQTLRILQSLIHSIMAGQEINNEKRGLDLGLSRGFSGQRAAKHLVGLANADFAGGPGKRR
ncbi:diuretic hormone class 2 isoform X2 [Brevipalpus obovatus]|uniref:diuretic hormone class 2 isoform X2 n=1 Tax=Brevipalpus obovatus TaxID=246614 RepID=UPI003D9DE62C